MNALTRYFDEVEKAPALAQRVGCSHTTLYRIAAGKTRARKGLERAIERETDGRVTRADLRSIADHGERDRPEPGGDAGVAFAAGEAAEESGEGEGGAASGHEPTVEPASGGCQREGFSP